jgi:hypothetical protein
MTGHCCSGGKCQHIAALTEHDVRPYMPNPKVRNSTLEAHKKTIFDHRTRATASGPIIRSTSAPSAEHPPEIQTFLVSRWVVYDPSCPLPRFALGGTVNLSNPDAPRPAPGLTCIHRDGRHSFWGRGSHHPSTMFDPGWFSSLHDVKITSAPAEARPTSPI